MVSGMYKRIPEIMPGEYRQLLKEPMIWKSALQNSRAAKASQAATPFPLGAWTAKATLALKRRRTALMMTSHRFDTLAATSG